MRFLGSIMRHDVIKEQFQLSKDMDRGNYPRRQLSKEMEQVENNLVEFNARWQCLVTWSVGDENSMWIPRKQCRTERGFTMCQTGWQHPVACGSHLSDGKVCPVPASSLRHTTRRTIGSHSHSPSAAVSVYDQPPWSSLLIFPKMWFFFSLSQRAIRKTEIKEGWRGEDRRQLWDLASFLD